MKTIEIYTTQNVGAEDCPFCDSDLLAFSRKVICTNCGSGGPVQRDGAMLSAKEQVAAWNNALQDKQKKIQKLKEKVSELDDVITAKIDQITQRDAKIAVQVSQLADKDAKIQKLKDQLDAVTSPNSATPVVPVKP